MGTRAASAFFAAWWPWMLIGARGAVILTVFVWWLLRRRSALSGVAARAQEPSAGPRLLDDPGVSRLPERQNRASHASTTGDLQVYTPAPTASSLARQQVQSLPSSGQTSPTMPGVTHCYTTLHAFNDEVSEARIFIFAGFHWRYLCRVSLAVLHRGWPRYGVENWCLYCPEASETIEVGE